MAEHARVAGPDEDQLVHQFLDAAPSAVLVFDQHQRIYYVNSMLEQLFGYTREELLGAPYELLMPERMREVLRQRVDDYLAHPEPRPLESRPDFPALRKDGTEFPMQYSATPIRTAAGVRVIVALFDVSSLREQAARTKSLGRSYLTLARMNEAVVRAQDSEALFAETCRVAVEEGGFLGAWVGRVHRVGGVVPVARCGVVGVDADALDRRADSRTGPIATALREGRAVYSRAPRTEMRSAMWAGFPEDGRPGASVCLPLLCEGRSHAVLTLYAEDPGAFDDNARRLLEEMARNVSFALDGFANTERLEQLVAQRRDLLSRLVTAQEAERDRIAADLHQETVPTLEGAGGRLEQLGHGVRERAPQLAPALDEVREVLTGATESLRHLLFHLEKPHAELGLAAAMRETAEHVFFDRSVRWTVAAEGVALRVGPSGQALRVLKEALINVRKHAHASQVEISARVAGDGVEFRVVDDGIGFDPEASPAPAGHRGLVTMRERAEMSGGWLRAGRGPTGGAEVAFWLPQDGPDDGWGL